jgi:MFS family permease
MTSAPVEERPEPDRDDRERRDHDHRRDGQERPLSRTEKRALALLGIPTLSLALAVTVVTTYLPVVARPIVGSTFVVGLIVGIEGLLALWLPLITGTWSDNVRTRLGGRIPFLIAGAPVIVVGLAFLAVAGSTAAIAGAALLFFIGYFIAYEPYRALYPDVIGDEAAGRAQASQALWRGAGTGLALLGGGLLLGIGRAAPFLFVAVVVAAGTAVFVVEMLRHDFVEHGSGDGRDIREETRRVVRLVRGSAELRAFAVANGLWELSLGALKTFIVLYVSAGLGFSHQVAALVIGGVAVVILLAALLSGKLADRFGPTLVLQYALPVYGLGMLGPLLFSNHIVVAASVPFVAIGGGVIMALPYAVLMPLMPEGEHGALTGYYSFSRGLGTWLGPLLAGAAITVLGHSLFSATHGYQAMWLPCSAAVLLSLIPLRRLRRAHGRAEASTE